MEDTERETETQAERERGREREAGSIREPDTDLILGLQDHALG